MPGVASRNNVARLLATIARIEYVVFKVHGSMSGLTMSSCMLVTVNMGEYGEDVQHAK
jgi:hypothetical protein